MNNGKQIVAIFVMILIGIMVLTPPNQSQSPLEQLQADERAAFHQMVKVLGEIDRTYPIESVRLKVRPILIKIQNKELHISMAALPADSWKNSRAYALIMNGRPTTLFMPGALVKIHQGGDKDHFTDHFVCLLMHESFHHGHHQLDRYKNGKIVYDTQKTRQERLSEESEAWWYTYQECMQPMRENGRYKQMGKNNLAGFNVFKEANGNQSDPTWQNFIAWAHEPIFSSP